MTLHYTKTLLYDLALAAASLTLSACQSTNGVPAANTSTSGSTATHNTENPPPPATASCGTKRPAVNFDGHPVRRCAVARSFILATAHILA